MMVLAFVLWFFGLVFISGVFIIGMMIGALTVEDRREALVKMVIAGACAFLASSCFFAAGVIW